MLKTNQDFPCKPFSSVLGSMAAEITIPAGTEVVAVADVQSCGFAVRDAKLIERLTGNTHDPKYRYVWVPASIVDSHE